MLNIIEGDCDMGTVHLGGSSSSSFVIKNESGSEAAWAITLSPGVNYGSKVIYCTCFYLGASAYISTGRKCAPITETVLSSLLI